MEKYYVYAYVRKSNGTPYYIGKGKGKPWSDARRAAQIKKKEGKID